MEPSTVHENILKIAIYAASNRAEFFQALQHHPDSPYRDQHDHPVTDHIDVIRRNIADVGEIIGALLDEDLTREQKSQLDRYVDERNAYIDNGLSPACAAILEGNYRKANEIFLEKALPLSLAAIHEAKRFTRISQAEQTLLNLSAIFGVAMVAAAVWMAMRAL